MTRVTIRRKVLTWIAVAAFAMSGAFVLEHDASASNTTHATTDNAVLAKADKPDNPGKADDKPPKHHKKCKDDSKKDQKEAQKGKPDKDKKGCENEEPSDAG